MCAMCVVRFLHACCGVRASGFLTCNSVLLHETEPNTEHVRLHVYAAISRVLIGVTIRNPI